MPAAWAALFVRAELRSVRKSSNQGLSQALSPLRLLQKRIFSTRADLASLRLRHNH